MPIQQLSIQIPMRRNDQIESSPKTIYLGQENIFDLNTKTRDRRISPNEHQGYMIDKPTEIGSYRGDDDDFPNRRLPLNTYNQNNMSPNRNQTSENYMGRDENEDELKKKKDKRQKIERLMNMQNIIYNDNDEENLDNLPDNNINYDIIYKSYGEDMKKLSRNIAVGKSNFRTNRRMTRKVTGFNYNMAEGRLTNQNIQSIIPSETFNDRHTVIHNMNKLSTILLSRNRDPNDRSSVKRHEEIEGANSFKDKERQTFSALRRPGTKFIRVIMAILCSKGMIYSN